MTNLRFEWDERKNQANHRKHGVGFAEASQVFLDPLHVSQQDRIERGEQRWVTMGVSAGFLLLVVAHTTTENSPEGENLEIIRIMSARRAGRKERQRYEDEDG